MIAIKTSQPFIDTYPQITFLILIACIDNPFMNLFYAPKNSENEFGEVRPFSHQLNSRFHEGPVSFNRESDRIFFTRNDYVNGKRKNDEEGIMKLQIYTSLKDGENWSTPNSLPFNTTDHEECHPSLSIDGNRLYFASNRPDGFGGMDIYYSDFAGGKWSEPINLGKDINTPGNEVFPYIHNDGTLYFASGGWAGLGGLDIFSTQINTNKKWDKAKNMGAPFNSAKDDFGLILNESGTEGYLSSARTGGMGKDDIYSFIISPEDSSPQKITATICAFEQGEEQKMAGVEVTFMEVNPQSPNGTDDDLIMKMIPTEKENEYVLKLNKNADEQADHSFTTNEQGKFVAELRPGKDYVFVAQKDGFLKSRKYYSTKEIAAAEEVDFCISLKKVNCLGLNGMVRNKKYGTEIPNAHLTLVNLCTGEEVRVRSDESGAFSFPCVSCGCDFILKGEKAYFRNGQERLSTVERDCASETGMSVFIDLQTDESIFAEAAKEEPSEIAAALSDKNGNITLGRSIELENIYYDYDRSRIRSGARVELDKVIVLLQQYPSMILELSSHTDSRGSGRYNEKLSQRRAEAAVNYINSKGIDRRRLVAKGYGEKQLRNNCMSDQECSEEEHQYNRRTEIKILQIEEGVKINYRDKGPEKIDRAH